MMGVGKKARRLGPTERHKRHVAQLVESIRRLLPAQDNRHSIVHLETAGYPSTGVLWNEGSQIGYTDRANDLDYRATSIDALARLLAAQTGADYVFGLASEADFVEVATSNIGQMQIARANMASDAVKSWRAAMRAKYGPKWFEVEGVKETRPGGRVREKIKAGKGPKAAADAGRGKSKSKSKGLRTAHSHSLSAWHNAFPELPGGDVEVAGLFNGHSAFTEVPYTRVRIVGANSAQDERSLVKYPPDQMGEFTSVVIGQRADGKYDVMYFDDEQPWMNIQFSGVNQGEAAALGDYLYGAANKYAMMLNPTLQALIARARVKRRN